MTGTADGAAVVAEAVNVDAADAALCAGCPHRNDRLAQGRCAPGDACVKAYSGRQIARLCDRHPDRADRCADDPGLEVGKTVARRLPVEGLGLMRCDDEGGRRAIAARLPAGELPTLPRYPGWRVRLIVSERAPLETAQLLIDDADCDVAETARERCHAAHTVV